MKTKPAIIYTRFSPRRHANTCESLDTQFEICTCHCKMHDMTVIGNYEDAALSGSNAANREGLQKAINHAIRCEAVLVFYSLSRLARSTKDALNIAERLQKGKAGLCSVKEALDTTTPMGKCIYTVMAAFNELDRNNIAQYTADAMRRHQNSGRRMSGKGKLPYGWRLDAGDDARMLPDDYELKAIDAMVALRAGGLGYREIANQMTAKGYIPRQVTKKGVTVAGKWYFGTIRRIIQRQESNLL